MHAVRRNALFNGAIEEKESREFGGPEIELVLERAVSEYERKRNLTEIQVEKR
jgi:hypothetical protein